MLENTERAVIVAALAHDGPDVAKGSLVGRLQARSLLLAPLDAAIQVRNAEAGHLHADETSWRVFEEVAGKANHLGIDEEVDR